MWLMMLRFHAGARDRSVGMGKHAGMGRTARWENRIRASTHAERAGTIARIDGQQLEYGPGNDRRVSVV